MALRANLLFVLGDADLAGELLQFGHRHPL
jgi:hypothetical protein